MGTSCYVALDLEHETATAASSSSSSLGKGLELPNGQGKEFAIGNAWCWCPGVFCLYNDYAEVTKEVSGRFCPCPCSPGLTQLVFPGVFLGRQLGLVSLPLIFTAGRRRGWREREIMCWNFFPLRAGIHRCPRNHLQHVAVPWGSLWEKCSLWRSHRVSWDLGSYAEGEDSFASKHHEE